MKSTFEQTKKPNKTIVAILIIAIAMFAIGGVVSAFFSDIFTGSSEGGTGTLDIDGTLTYFLNGASASLNDIKNLVPGDVLVIKGEIENNGNQSAWIREKISFSAIDPALVAFFEVYYGEHTQADFVTGTNPTGTKLTLTDGAAVSGNKIIDGSGANAVTETPSGDNEYDYLEDSSYSFAITIYFSKFATNSTQGKAFTLNIAVQALQFKNNNTVEPDEDAWVNVVEVVEP